MKKIKYNLLIGLLLLESSIGLSAQTEDNNGGSVAQLDLYQQEAFAFDRADASDLALGQWKSYSNIYVGINYKDGTFHRPQQSSSATDYLFSAEGALKMGEYRIAGGFSLEQSYNKNVRFNSIIDPYRGTPYILADSTGGNWQKQSYALWAKGASPFFHNLISVGLDLQLNVDRGSKKIDPRPQSNVNSISVAPSVTLKQNDFSLGAYIRYRRFRENSNLILYNTNEPQKIYMLKGIGQYVYDIFSNNERERQYQGDGLGYGLTFGVNKEHISMDVYADYANYTEDAMDIESNKPRKRGCLYETHYTGGTHINIYSERAKHLIAASYFWQERSGREIIQIFNSSPTVNAWQTDSEAPRRSVNKQTAVKGSYSLFLFGTNRQKEKDDYLWKFDLEARYETYSDTYKVMDSYLKYAACHIEAGTARNIALKGNNSLLIHVNGGYHSPSDKSFNYTERETTDPTIAQGLIYPDRDILWSSYYTVGGDVTFSHQLAKSGTLYLRAGYQTLQAQHNLQRNTVWTRFGYIF
ncbi:DUF6850 family outer membrane beta-barrel protein [Bacteroides faecalis]|uniref:DUF6850 domain-containing protein n=1 Tax=Bacteroides faecalis TaxID=2447885 RepID=A0A401LZS9_9BACE|nr:DUF6850 family outer membrane beta-barrel protein [Bacteroides faecalis]GCB37041.1 hypothetical protein KGMB02408_39860 [Bacteroides faecalis]